MKVKKQIKGYTKKIKGRTVRVRPHTKVVTKSTAKFCDACGTSLQNRNVPIESADNNLVEEFKKSNKILRIYPDTNPESPREWDNLGIMTTFHNRYDLGDKHNLKADNFDGWDDIQKYLVKEEGAILIRPLYLYDHSGLRIKIGSFAGLLPQGHARFDSGMIGFIYTTKKKINDEGLTEVKAKKILEGEVETYDQYLSGDVYGYQLWEAKKCKKCGGIQWGMTDSIWGFYGSENNFKDIKENVGW